MKVWCEKGATPYAAGVSYGALDWNMTLDQCCAAMAAAIAKKSAFAVTALVRDTEKFIRATIKRLKKEKRDRIRRAREAKEKAEKKAKEKETREYEAAERKKREAKEKADRIWRGATDFTRVWRSHKYADRRAKLLPLREKYSPSGRRRAREAIDAQVAILRLYFEVHDASELFAAEYPSDEELKEFMLENTGVELEELMKDTYGEGLEWFAQNHLLRAQRKREQEEELVRSKWQKVEGGAHLAEQMGQKGALEKLASGKDGWDTGASSVLVIARSESDVQGVAWKTAHCDKGYAIGLSVRKEAPVREETREDSNKASSSGEGRGGNGKGAQGKGKGKGAWGEVGKGKGGKGKGVSDGKGKGGGKGGNEEKGPTNVSEIGFALYCNKGSFLSVQENGKDKGIVVQYNAGDELAIKVEGDCVSYERNETVFYTSEQTPVFPLVVAVAFCDRGAKATDIEMGELV
jgi:hypothetical protein